MNAYTVEPAVRCDVDHLVMKHYLHRWPGVTVCTLGLLCEDQTAYIGVIVFALPPRETAKRYGVTVAWELARLFIEDGTPKNTETWFMSRAIAYVKRARPEVELLISYADPSAGPCWSDLQGWKLDCRWPYGSGAEDATVRLRSRGKGLQPPCPRP